MTISSFKEAEETIRKWLTDSGHSVQELEDENSNFNFKIDYPIGQRFQQQIVQPKKVPDLVLVISPIKLPDLYIGVLKKMKKNKREALISELRRALIFAENQYEFKFDSDGLLSSVVFSYPVYFDGLSKDRLYRALNVNFKTRAYLFTVLDEKSGKSILPYSPHPSAKKN